MSYGPLYQHKLRWSIDQGGCLNVDCDCGQFGMIASPESPVNHVIIDGKRHIEPARPTLNYPAHGISYTERDRLTTYHFEDQPPPFVPRPERDVLVALLNWLLDELQKQPDTETGDHT